VDVYLCLLLRLVVFGCVGVCLLVTGFVLFMLFVNFVYLGFDVRFYNKVVLNLRVNRWVCLCSDICFIRFLLLWYLVYGSYV